MYRDDATLTTEAVNTYGNTVTLTGHVRTRDEHDAATQHRDGD